MNSKYFPRLLLICCVMLSTSNCAKDSEEKASSIPDQEAVVTVNGNSISKRQLDRSVAMINNNRPLSQINATPDAQKALRQDVLKKLIRMELLYQDSQTKNLVASNEEVENTINKIKSQLSNEDGFKKFLEKQRYSQQDLRDEIKRNLSIKRLVDQEINTKLVVTDEESNTFYKNNEAQIKQPEGVRVRHVLAKLDKNATPEIEAAAKEKIEKIKERVNKGEDFAELARKNSDCPSAKNGGDLGFIVRGKTVPEFEKCAFGLKQPGEVSEVIKTPFGYHVVKLVEKRPAGKIPYEKAKQDIVKFLKNRKMNGKLNKYVQNLYSKAKVESRIDLKEATTAPIATP